MSNKMDRPLVTVDGRTLMDRPLEPPNFVVDTLISQGLHILAGSPKVGKSLPQSQVVNSQKASGIKEIHLLYRLPSCFVLILFTVLPLIWDKKKQETFSDFPLSRTVRFF